MDNGMAAENYSLLRQKSIGRTCIKIKDCIEEKKYFNSERLGKKIKIKNKN